MAGAGVARDPAIRGLRRPGGARPTSPPATSRSSKLIHAGSATSSWATSPWSGGAREREPLGRWPPTRYGRGFLVPVYRGGTRRLITVRIGLRLYDLLTPGKRTGPLPDPCRPSRAWPWSRASGPTNLLGVGYYFDDLLLSPERLCLGDVLSARLAGARTPVNYAQAEELTTRPSGGWTVRVRDLVSGDVVRLDGHVVVNAAGPWVDRVRALAGPWTGSSRPWSG